MIKTSVDFVFVEASANTQAMGIDLADVIVKSNLAGTKSEARRHIASGAIRLNDRKIEDPFARLMLDAEGHFVVIQKPIEPTDPVV